MFGRLSFHTQNQQMNVHKQQGMNEEQDPEENNNDEINKWKSIPEGLRLALPTAPL